MATKEKIRVVFTFEERGLAALEEMTADGNYSCLAETVRDSLTITRALQTHAKKGYSQIIVRDPVTEEERLLIIPTIRAVSMGDRPPSKRQVVTPISA